MSVCFLIYSNIFSQWVQTNGPYGSVNAFAFFTYDPLKVVGTKCGLFSSENVKTRWNLEKVSDVYVWTRKEYCLFLTDPYGNLALIDLSERGFNHVSFDFMSLGINALANSDSCLYAGTDYGGFYLNRYFISNGKVS